MGFYYSTWAIYALLTYILYKAFPDQPPALTTISPLVTHRPRKGVLRGHSELSYQELKLKPKKVKPNLKRQKRSFLELSNSFPVSTLIVPIDGVLKTDKEWHPKDTGVDVLLRLSNSKRFANYKQSNDFHDTYYYLDKQTTESTKIERYQMKQFFNIILYKKSLLKDRPLWNYLARIYQPVLENMETEIMGDQKPSIIELKRSDRNAEQIRLTKRIQRENKTNNGSDEIFIKHQMKTQNTKGHHKNDNKIEEIIAINLKTRAISKNSIKIKTKLDFEPTESTKRSEKKNKKINNGSKRWILPQLDQETTTKADKQNYTTTEEIMMLELWIHNDNKNSSTTKTSTTERKYSAKDEGVMPHNNIYKVIRLRNDTTEPKNKYATEPKNKNATELRKKILTISRKKNVTLPRQSTPMVEKVPVQKVMKKISKGKPKKVAMFSKTKSKQNILFRNEIKMHKMGLFPMKMRTEFEKHEKRNQKQAAYKNKQTPFVAQNKILSRMKTGNAANDTLILSSKLYYGLVT